MELFAYYIYSFTLVKALAFQHLGRCQFGTPAVLSDVISHKYAAESAVWRKKASNRGTEYNRGGNFINHVKIHNIMQNQSIKANQRNVLSHYLLTLT